MMTDDEAVEQAIALWRNKGAPPTISLGTSRLFALAPVFRKTRDVLDERGWCQHITQNTDGRVCLTGALLVALGLDPWRGSVSNEATSAMIVMEWVARTSNIFTWNDHEDRTVDEVKALIRDAIEYAETA